MSAVTNPRRSSAGHLPMAASPAIGKIDYLCELSVSAVNMSIDE